MINLFKKKEKDIQFVDNSDFENNKTVMVEGLPKLIESLQTNGFKEIVFNTSNPFLKKFCIHNLGFQEINGEDLRRFI